MNRFLLLSIMSLWIAVSVFASSDKNASPAKTSGGATILFESFENGVPPSGWASLNNGSSNSGWNESTSMYETGSSSAYISPDLPWKAQDAWIVTPALDLSGIVNGKLVFYEGEHYWASSGDTHKIKVSTTSQTDVNSFSDLLVMTPADHTVNGFGNDPVTVYLQDYAGESTVYIAFQYIGAYADYWYIDDVGVYEAEDHDVRAVSLDMDSHYSVSTSAQPKGTIQNVGSNTESFSVSFGYLDWDGSEIIIETKNVTDLPIGDEEIVTFSSYTFSAENQYKYFIKTLLTGDEDSSNDVAYKAIDTFSDTKDMVLFEKGTGVTCPNCVAASRALDSLHSDYPETMSLVEYHNYDTDNDPFSTPDADGRTGYYNITGYPTVVAGGTHVKVGGGGCDVDWVPLYDDYKAFYDAVRQENTGFGIELTFSEAIATDTTITAVSTTTFNAPSYLKTFKLRYVLEESNIPYTWETCMESIEFCERKMYPDYNGKTLYDGSTAPYTDMTVTDTIVFTFPSGVVKENSDLIVFIQNDENKEIMAVAKVNMANEPNAIADRNIEQIPTMVEMDQNYPNPFNPLTSISYRLNKATNVELTVFNTAGQKIRTLVSGEQAVGEHTVLFNGENMATGVYYYKIITSSFTQVRKMLLVK